MLRAGIYPTIGTIVIICCVLLAGGCDVSMEEGQFRCVSDDDCPNGWSCNRNGDAHCYSPEVMADSGAANADTNTTADTMTGSTATDASTDETGSEGGTDTDTLSDEGNDTTIDSETATGDVNDTQTVTEADSNTESDIGADTQSDTGEDSVTDIDSETDTENGIDSEDTGGSTDTETVESTDDDTGEDTSDDTGDDTEEDTDDDTGVDTDDDTEVDTGDDTGEDTNDDTGADTGQSDNSCSHPILITQSDGAWSGNWTAFTATFSQNSPTGCGAGITDVWFRVFVPGKGSVSMEETTAASVVIREVSECGDNSCDGYSDESEQYMLTNNANVPRYYYIVVSESPSNTEDLFSVTFGY